MLPAGHRHPEPRSAPQHETLTMAGLIVGALSASLGRSDAGDGPCPVGTPPLSVLRLTISPAHRDLADLAALLVAGRRAKTVDFLTFESQLSGFAGQDVNPKVGPNFCGL